MQGPATSTTENILGGNAHSIRRVTIGRVTTKGTTIITEEIREDKEIQTLHQALGTSGQEPTPSVWMKMATAPTSNNTLQVNPRLTSLHKHRMHLAGLTVQFQGPINSCDTKRRPSLPCLQHHPLNHQQTALSSTALIMKKLLLRTPLQ